MHVPPPVAPRVFLLGSAIRHQTDSVSNEPGAYVRFASKRSHKLFDFREDMEEPCARLVPGSHVNLNAFRI
jgi:hypothetical protein